MDFIKNNIWLTNQNCALCERFSSDKNKTLCGLCCYCFDSLPWNGKNSGAGGRKCCFRCGLAIPITELGTAKMQSCGACLAKDPIQYRSVSAFEYEFPLPELIAQIKFNRQLHYLNLLAELFAQHCLTQYQEDSLPELILPIPLHPHREFKRSFNQAELLSSRIARILKIETNAHLIFRVRHTPSQMALKIAERKKNVAKAFVLNDDFYKHADIQHIAIFDDVVTTGSTTHSVALLLKRAGIKRIDIWSLARTPKPN